MSKRNARSTYAMTRHAEELLLSLVVNMVGETNLIPAMGQHRVVPDLIPVNDDTPQVTFARMVLQLLYRAAEDRLPPTQENILPGLRLEYGDETDELWERLWNRRGIQDAPSDQMVQSLSLWLSEELGLGTLKDAAGKMEAIVRLAEGNNADIHNEMSQVLMDASPARYKVDVLPLHENYDLYEQLLIEREQMIATRGSTGPESPWPLLNRHIAGLRKGEYALWSGKTGWGKSFIAWKLARHAAWKQGYNVVLLHFEQRMESIMDRLMAEEFMLFPADFRNPGRKLDPTQTGVFKPSDPEWAKRMAQMRAVLAKMSAERGNIWLVHSTGWGPFQIETEIAHKVALSQAEGRDLLVIWDYYDLVNPKGLEIAERSKIAVLEATIDFIREKIAQQYQTYNIVMAQDNVKADYETDFMPYNSQRVWARSQVYVRIERFRAQEPLSAIDQQGKPMYDMFGRQIFLHDAGEAHSNTLLHVIKGSDDKTGYVPVRVWNGRFRVDEMSLTPTEKKALIAEVKLASKNASRRSE